MSTKPVLYHYWRSSSSWRVRWALELKSIEVDFVHVDLLSGESEQEPHKSRNPFGYVPALDWNGRMMIESVAILEFLDELYTQNKLYPGDAYQRAHIRALVEVINADTQPIQNIPVMDYYSADEGKRKEWSQHFIRRGLNAFETMVKKTAGKYCFGDQVTAADILLVPQCYNALRFGVDLNEFPTVLGIYTEAMKTKEAQNSAPDRFMPKK